jgi:hypothetical protein
MPTTSALNYKNIETKHFRNGNKTVRKVVIQNGRGTKTIMHYKKGKCCGKMSKRIDNHHVKMICNGVFVKGLFSNCVANKKRTRKQM